MSELAIDIQLLRIEELPAYLASSSHDVFISELLGAIHAEVGLENIRPVASLHQAGWFAAYRRIPEAPLYLLPASIVNDFTELPLIFHEIGHTLFKLWGDEFYQRLESVLISTFDRKKLEIIGVPDPRERLDLEQSLGRIKEKLAIEIEEFACDIVGALLGGDAFVLAHGLSFFGSTTSNPFDYTDPLYPPLDCRIRVCRQVPVRFGVDLNEVATIEENWRRFREKFSPEPWYNWIYDNKYLDDLIIATQQFLADKQLRLYTRDISGIRSQLSEGLIYALRDAKKHAEWIKRSHNTLV